MNLTEQSLMEGWSGLAVVKRLDRETGTWIYIALHDDTLGTPVGGCRMKVYESPAHGLRDALRLAEGMTHKWAALGFDFGGGKSVLAIPHPMAGAEREGLVRRFGRLLQSLSGTYRTGEDMGTTPEDMLLMSQETEYVMGASPTGEPIDPGPYTALGVKVGIQAAFEHRFGNGSFEGRSVLIQGVGDVGYPLARMVSEEGGQVLFSDLDGDRAAARAEELGGTVVVPEAVYETECDVYAPCAVGATVNARTIPLLRCQIVGGSANNQLERAEDAGALADRGILYAPDYVINGGGALAFGLMQRGTTDEAELRERVSGIRAALAAIFDESAREGGTPLDASMRIVERALAKGRSMAVAS